MVVQIGAKMLYRHSVHWLKVWDRILVIKELHRINEENDIQICKLMRFYINWLCFDLWPLSADIQSKLFQCQELLSRYKNQLLEREDQLNSSITEMVNQKVTKELFPQFTTICQTFREKGDKKEQFNVIQVFHSSQTPMHEASTAFIHELKKKILFWENADKIVNTTEKLFSKFWNILLSGWHDLLGDALYNLGGHL